MRLVQLRFMEVARKKDVAVVELRKKITGSINGGMLCEKGKPFVMPVERADVPWRNPAILMQTRRPLLVRLLPKIMPLSNLRQGGVDQLKKALGGGGGAPNIGGALKGLFGH